MQDLILVKIQVIQLKAMSDESSSNLNENAESKKAWFPIAVATIGAAATIVVGYWQFYPKEQPDSKDFVGRVMNAKTEQRLRGAKISLEADDTPPVIYTDSEGVFSFPIKNFDEPIRIQVEADGYEMFDRRIKPSSKSDIEYIRLMPISLSSTKVSTAQKKSQPTQSVVQENYSSGSNISANRDVHFNEAPKSIKTVQDSIALALKKGMSYEKGRQILIDKGWQPVVPGSNGEFPNLDNPQIRYIFKDREYHEISDCSGTGLGFCLFHFYNGIDKNLFVTTVNNEEGKEITIWSWRFENPD